jgi:hypothetical protein
MSDNDIGSRSLRPPPTNPFSNSRYPPTHLPPSPLIIPFIVLVVGVVILAGLIIMYVYRDNIFGLNSKSSSTALNDAGYGTYSEATYSDCLTATGKCSDKGYRTSVQICNPHPTTNSGCLDSQGNQTYSSIIDTLPCSSVCRSSVWEQPYIGTDKVCPNPLAFANGPCVYFFDATQKIYGTPIPDGVTTGADSSTNVFGEKYLRLKCKSNDPNGDTNCTFVCGGPYRFIGGTDANGQPLPNPCWVYDANPNYKNDICPDGSSQKSGGFCDVTTKIPLPGKTVQSTNWYNWNQTVSNLYTQEEGVQSQSNLISSFINLTAIFGALANAAISSITSSLNTSVSVLQASIVSKYNLPQIPKMVENPNTDKLLCPDGITTLASVGTLNSCPSGYKQNEKWIGGDDPSINWVNYIRQDPQLINNGDIQSLLPNDGIGLPNITYTVDYANPPFIPKLQSAGKIVTYNPGDTIDVFEYCTDYSMPICQQYGFRIDCLKDPGLCTITPAGGQAVLHDTDINNHSLYSLSTYECTNTTILISSKECFIGGVNSTTPYQAHGVYDLFEIGYRHFQLDCVNVIDPVAFKTDASNANITYADQNDIDTSIYVSSISKKYNTCISLQNTTNSIINPTLWQENTTTGEFTSSIVPNPNPKPQFTLPCFNGTESYYDLFGINKTLAGKGSAPILCPNPQWNSRHDTVNGHLKAVPGCAQPCFYLDQTSTYGDHTSGLTLQSNEAPFEQYIGVPLYMVITNQYPTNTGTPVVGVLTLNNTPTPDLTKKVAPLANISTNGLRLFDGMAPPAAFVETPLIFLDVASKVSYAIPQSCTANITRPVGGEYSVLTQSILTGPDKPLSQGTPDVSSLSSYLNTQLVSQSGTLLVAIPSLFVDFTPFNDVGTTRNDPTSTIYNPNPGFNPTFGTPLRMDLQNAMFFGLAGFHGGQYTGFITTSSPVRDAVSPSYNFVPYVFGSTNLPLNPAYIYVSDETGYPYAPVYVNPNAAVSPLIADPTGKQAMNGFKFIQMYQNYTGYANSNGLRGSNYDVINNSLAVVLLNGINNGVNRGYKTNNGTSYNVNYNPNVPIFRRSFIGSGPSITNLNFVTGNILSLFPDNPFTFVMTISKITYADGSGGTYSQQVTNISPWVVTPRLPGSTIYPQLVGSNGPYSSTNPFMDSNVNGIDSPSQSIFNNSNVDLRFLNNNNFNSHNVDSGTGPKLQSMLGLFTLDLKSSDPSQSYDNAFNALLLARRTRCPLTINHTNIHGIYPPCNVNYAYSMPNYSCPDLTDDAGIIIY